MDKERERRIAQNESLFREVNERIEEGAQRYLVENDPEAVFICECGDAACTEPMRLTLPEYEAVRANPARFAIKRGHEIPAVERVVEETDRFAVVEKTGLGSEVATDTDPRSS